MPDDLREQALKEDPAIDVVYGAYQRGFYRTALELAKIRATEKNDPVAMTMLGELYSSTPGIRRHVASTTASGSSGVPILLLHEAW